MAPVAQIEVVPQWLTGPPTRSCANHLPISPLVFYPNELAHMAFMTGKMFLPSLIYFPRKHKQSPSAGGNPARSLQFEFISRCAMLHAYFDSKPKPKGTYGDMVATELASNLDPTEKANASYFLGQAFTGLYCKNQLGARTILHTSFVPGVVPGPYTTKPSADLLALDDQGRLIVAEAKGCSGSIRKSRLAYSIGRQVCSVLGIEASSAHPRPVCAPRVRFGAVAHWSTNGHPVGLRVMCVHCGNLTQAQSDGDDTDDPQEVPKRSRDQVLFNHYLRIWTLLLMLTDDMTGDSLLSLADNELPGYCRVEIAPVRVAVGIATEIAEILRDFVSDVAGEPSISDIDLGGFADNIAPVIENTATETQDHQDPRLMGDGTLFEIDWPIADSDNAEG